MPRSRGRQQVVIAVGMLAVGIEPIGQQREPQIALAVAEVVDLQAATWASTSAALVSSIGTTTSVRISVGTPSSRSSRGSGRGPSDV